MNMICNTQAVVILAQHANQGKLTGAETSLARWLVYVHTHCDLPLDYRDGQKGFVVGCVNSYLRPEKARPGRSGITQPTGEASLTIPVSLGRSTLYWRSSSTPWRTACCTRDAIQRCRERFQNSGLCKHSTVKYA